MTNTNRSHARPACTMLAYTAKAALLMLPLGMALSSAGHHPAQAQTSGPQTSGPQTSGPSCAAALDALMSEWRSIGFVEPGKPAQMVVSGRHGFTTTGGQFNFMRQQIRVGASDCEAGRDVDALRHFELVRGILARIGPA
jgi:hypothetical protein